MRFLPVSAFSLLPILHTFVTAAVFIPGSQSTSSWIGPKSQLYLTNDHVAPDGYNRSAVIVNGAFPPPTIRANKTDQFAIDVYNELADTTMPVETSIHWHGIFKKRSNWADGVAFVTQCPLTPNNSFQYRFNLINQTGTYWYHSHYSTQYCDGLRGALVIYDDEDPLAHMYDVDDENTIITLFDWYHIPSLEILGDALPNATLINGRGRHPGGPEMPFSVVNVKEGLRYRFRIVSASCNPGFNFSIDGHRMTIIEADGNEVEPVETDVLPIYAGQRYSVVVAADKIIDNYWIRALSSVPNASYDGGQNLAILRYEGASDEDPTTSEGPRDIAFDERKLHPLINPGVPGVPEIGKADANLVLQIGNNATRSFTINNVSFAPPAVPVLLQILSGARHPSQLLPNGSIYELPLDKVIEISFPDPTAAFGSPHPIHLHGHAFDVVRLPGTNDTNFVNPVRRDVVSLGVSASDNVTIRFKTDNPGPWFLHCHIDWHLLHGFAVVMAEAPSEAAREEGAVIPEEWYRLCSQSSA